MEWYKDTDIYRKKGKLLLYQHDHKPNIKLENEQLAYNT